MNCRALLALAALALACASAEDSSVEGYEECFARVFPDVEASASGTSLTDCTEVLLCMDVMYSDIHASDLLYGPAIRDPDKRRQMLDVAGRWAHEVCLLPCEEPEFICASAHDDGKRPSVSLWSVGSCSPVSGPVFVDLRERLATPDLRWDWNAGQMLDSECADFWREAAHAYRNERCSILWEYNDDLCNPDSPDHNGGYCENSNRTLVESDCER